MYIRLFQQIVYDNGPNTEYKDGFIYTICDGSLGFIVSVLTNDFVENYFVIIVLAGCFVPKLGQHEGCLSYAPRRLLVAY